MTSKEFLEDSPMQLLAKSDGCVVYQAKNGSGDGTMTMYEVFPGVSLAYNDYHMRDYNMSYTPRQSIFCIDHCREGRMEYPTADGALSYMEAGDLKLDRRLNHVGPFDFPLAHFHGITIFFELPTAAESLPLEVRNFPVDLYALQQKFCADGRPMVLRGAPTIEHIFSELYTVPLQIRQPYFKIKILELLLFLDALALPSNETELPYFYKSQVEKVKGIERLITTELDSHFTLTELSARFDLPLTPLKACFKNVFGSPVNVYLRCCRMNRAAVLLRQSRSASVAEIAGQVGYDSPSKFAAAFKAVMGKTPLEYRQGNG